MANLLGANLPPQRLLRFNAKVNRWTYVQPKQNEDVLSEAISNAFPPPPPILSRSGVVHFSGRGGEAFPQKLCLTSRDKFSFWNCLPFCVRTTSSLLLLEQHNFFSLLSFIISVSFLFSEVSKNCKLKLYINGVTLDTTINKRNYTHTNILIPICSDAEDCNSQL